MILNNLHFIYLSIDISVHKEILLKKINIVISPFFILVNKKSIFAGLF